MTRNNIFLVAISCFVIFCVLIICSVILPMSLDYVSFDTQPGLGGVQYIFGNTEFEQRIIVDKDNFSAVGLSIKNPNLRNKKDLILNVYDLSNIQLRRSVVNGMNIPDGEFVKFYFDPIRQSSGEEYTLTFLSEEQDEGNSLGLYLTNTNTNWIVNKRNDSKGYYEALSLVRIYKITSKSLLLKSIVGDFIYRLRSDTIFMITYTILLAGLVVKICRRS